jgi:16S rRNA (uracil1498-N3)-methyltransferase
LYLAVIKFPRWEWALEKVTELGVRSIHPLAADHSEVGLVQAASKRLGRWRKIAEEAAQQSRRLGPPEVGAVITPAEALARPAGARLPLDFEAPPLREALPAPVADSASSLALFVGPEGGWSDAERRAWESAGLAAASLGHNVLRAETAAIAAVALIAHLLEA